MMRTIDFSPYYRSSVGFDRLFSLLDNFADSGETSYPPYNIEIIGENRYRITMAVAGLSEADINAEVKENTLIISSRKKDNKDAKRVFLHQGLAERMFERRFRLADHVQVESANLQNGLLNIDLVREIPDAMKARNIAITHGEARSSVVDAQA